MRTTASFVLVLFMLLVLALAPLPKPSVAQFFVPGGDCANGAMDLWQIRHEDDLSHYVRLFREARPFAPPSGSPPPGEPLRYWDTGAPVASGDYNPGVDLQDVNTRLMGTRVFIMYSVAGPSNMFPVFFKVAIDLSGAGGDTTCLWCRALDLFGPSTAYAQGPTNAFMGAGLREDVVLFAQIDGPGRTSLQRVVGTTVRPLAGSVQVSGNQVTIDISLTVAVELGLARPGVRIVFGAVGAPPKSAYDRVPKQGAVQIGLRGQMSVDPGPMTKAKFDLVAAGKDVLYYLDTNGDGLIDAIARDRDGDGRINFLQSEGPVLLTGPGQQPVQFSEVQQSTVDTRKAFLAFAGRFLYYTLVQDLNGDGDVSDEGEFRSWLLRR